MPLPTEDLAWPPVQLAEITPSLAEWDAWYVGTPDRLETVYGRSVPDTPAAAQATKPEEVDAILRKYGVGPGTR